MSTVSRGRGPATLLGTVVGLLALLSGPALAYWTQAGSGAGVALSGTLHAPTGVTGDAGTHLVSWTASSTTGAVAPSGYAAERSAVADPDDSARSWSAACTTTGASCTDAAFPTAGGTYRFVYRVTAAYSTAWTAFSVESPVVTVTVVPPLAVSTPDLADASDSGTSSTDNLTNVTTPTLTGTATAGATVQLLEDGTVVGSGTATGGAYSIQTTALTGGTGTAHVITAQALLGPDTATSPGSVTVTVDTSAPAVGTITVGNDGTSSNNKQLSGTASTGNSHPGAQTAVTVSVSGVAAAGCSVSPATASIDQSTAAWSGPTVALNRHFSCTATVTLLDSAGNAGTSTATVNRG